jgi:hypothetical protein
MEDGRWRAFLVSVLALCSLIISSCLRLVDEGDPMQMEAPDALTEAEFLAISHLDEHPVREEAEVTAMVENFMRAVQGSAGGISGIPEPYNVPIDSGFAVKSAETNTEIVPSSSVLPFYRYTIEDATANKTGQIIASGDKRIGNIIAYIEEDSDDPVTVPFMEIIPFLQPKKN